MSSVPMPRDLSEEAVRKWVRAVSDCDVPAHNCRSCLNTARAVLALVRAKVREAVEMDRSFSRATEGLRKGSYFVEYHKSPDEIVSRVLGDHPKGGHEAEGREAPRG